MTLAPTQERAQRHVLIALQGATALIHHQQLVKRVKPEKPARRQGLSLARLATLVLTRLKVHRHAAYAPLVATAPPRCRRLAKRAKPEKPAQQKEQPCARLVQTPMEIERGASLVDLEVERLLSLTGQIQLQGQAGFLTGRGLG